VITVIYGDTIEHVISVADYMLKQILYLVFCLFSCKQIVITVEPHL